MFQETLSINTHGRGTYDVTERLQALCAKSGVSVGLCHLFIQHTSASIILCENADRSVREDLERFMSSMVPDGDRRFLHTQEGPDDMPAHVRTVLTDCTMSIPITDGRCALGVWQGVYLWEHRAHGRVRRLTVTIQGEKD